MKNRLSFGDRVAFASIGGFLGAIIGVFFSVMFAFIFHSPTIHLSAIWITAVVCATVGFVTGNRVGDFLGIILPFIGGIVLHCFPNEVETETDKPEKTNRVFLGVVVVLMCVVTYVATR